MQFESGYTGDGFTTQADEDFAEQEACDRAVEGLLPADWVWAQNRVEERIAKAKREAKNMGDVNLWNQLGDAETIAIATPHRYCREGMTWEEWRDILRDEETSRSGTAV